MSERVKPRVPEHTKSQWDDRFRTLNHYTRGVANQWSRGNDSDADDLAQDAWVRVLQNAATSKTPLDFSQKPFGLMRKVVKNAYIDRGRKKARRPLEVRPSDDALKLLDYVEDGRSVDEDIIEEPLVIAIRKLAPEFRETFVLFSVHGMSYEQISLHLRVPEGTVKSRINRARRYLREELDFGQFSEEEPAA